MAIGVGLPSMPERKLHEEGGNKQLQLYLRSSSVERQPMTGSRQILQPRQQQHKHLMPVPTQTHAAGNSFVEVESGQ